MEVAKNGIPETALTKFVDSVGAAAGENSETVTYTIPAVPPMPEEEFELFKCILEGVESVYHDTYDHPCYII